MSPDQIDALINALTIFTLAILVGFAVISKVPATLHTPLLDATVADRTMLWAVTYNQTVALPQSGGAQSGGMAAQAELILACQWEGGEHYQTAGSQSLPTGFSENACMPVHWGWAAPAPGRQVTLFDPDQTLPGAGTLYTSPMLGYFEAHPTLALRWGHEGFVTVRLLIDARGTVQEVSVRERRGPQSFEEAVTSVIRQWRFTPARHRGQDVAVWADKTIEFRLEEDR